MITMDIDSALKEVQEYGPLQRKIVWLSSISQAFVAFHHLQNVFVAAEPAFQCASNPDVHVCQSSCDRYVFISSDFTSIVSEWNLLCGKAYLADFVQSVFMAGLLIGNVIGGAIADHYGRRRIMYISMMCVFLSSALSSYARSYEEYVAWRLLAGIFTGSYGLISFTLPTELVGADQRGFVNILNSICFASGIAMLSLLAYFIRDWKQLSVVTALPGLLSLYFYKYLPESPRWLLSKGRAEAAEQVLKNIALANTGSLPSTPITLKCHSVIEDMMSTSLMFFLRSRVLFLRTINNIYTWLVIAAVYYGLTMKAGSLGLNKYISIAVAGLIEVPAIFLTWYLMDRLGRRWTYSWSMVAGGVFCLLILIIPADNPKTITTLAVLGKIGISMSFCVSWVHAAEMYPTNVRNNALGICCMAARIGGIISPFILTAGRFHSNIDFLIFGAMSFTGGIISRALPETLNKPMPNTLDDIHLDH